MSSRSRAFDVVNWIMAGLFLVSAGLQYNDPDPLRWAAIYVAASAACLSVGRFTADWIPATLVLVAAAVWIGLFTPEVVEQARPRDLFKSMSDKGGAAELAREMGGLVIVAVWMAVVALVARRRHR